MNIKHSFKLILFVIFISKSLFASEINIEINNLKNTKGQLLIELYNSKESFLEKKYKSVKLNVTSRRMSYTFEDIPNGYYALFVLHDENFDNEANISMLFSEDGYGISNNIKIFFGMTDFDNAKFFLKEISNINIDINY